MGHGTSTRHSWGPVWGWFVKGHQTENMLMMFDKLESVSLSLDDIKLVYYQYVNIQKSNKDNGVKGTYFPNEM